MKLVVGNSTFIDHKPALWIPDSTPHKKSLNVLVGCERSGTVRDQFRLLGHKAWSVDLEKQTHLGRFSEFHLRMDIFDAINCSRSLLNISHWDLFIAHPPCTYLAVSGNAWFKIHEGRLEKRDEALAFFRKCLHVPIEFICLENPRSQASKVRKPSQLIHPYFFGDPDQKETFLWLKNLPLLRPTNILEEFSTDFVSRAPGSSKKQAARSKTFPGIAKAIAEQYGRFVSEQIS